MAKMKDSGVEWIGEIPEGWEVRPLKSLFSFGKGLPITKENLIEKGISVISYGQIHSKNNSGTKLQSDLFRYVDSSYLESGSNSLVHKGDFIFADTSEDLEGCGNCVYVDDETELFAGYHTVVLQTKESNENKYLAYLFKTDEWRKQIREKLVEVKLYSITRKVLKTTTVILPPKETQQKIATYLNEKCSQIEQTIQNQQQVIEKLKAYKQSLITEAVTGKVKIQNGKVAGKYEQYKDSGVEWIGEIPSWWIVEKSRYAISKIGDIDHDMPESVNNGIPYLMTGDLKEKLSEVDFTDCKKVSMQDFQILSKKCKANKGDLVFARYATIGTVMYIDCNVDFLISYSCVTVKPDRDILSGKYLFYYFKSKPYFEEINKYINSNTQGNVGIDSMYRAKICIPCFNAQIEIATYLDKTCATIDSAIEQKQKLIEKLTEYKKSLIYECVTGKREVKS